MLCNMLHTVCSDENISTKAQHQAKRQALAPTQTTQVRHVLGNINSSNVNIQQIQNNNVDKLGKVINNNNILQPVNTNNGVLRHTQVPIITVQQQQNNNVVTRPSIDINLETNNIDAMLISPLPQKTVSKTNNNNNNPTANNNVVTQVKYYIPNNTAGELSITHLYVPDYMSDMLQYMLNNQYKYIIPSNYMASIQNDVNHKMREILIDWLHEVCNRFRLSSETMFLTVYIIDKFLSQQPINRLKLQLLGCASMLLASKYQEIYIPEIYEFVHISDNAFERNDMIDYEHVILGKLNFNISVHTPLAYMERIILLYNIEHDSNMYYFIMYILQIALQNYDMLKYNSVTQACSAIYITLYMNNMLYKWNEATMVNVIGLDIQLFKSCVYDISNLVCRITSHKYQAVHRKFHRTMYKKVGETNNLTAPIVIA